LTRHDGTQFAGPKKKLTLNILGRWGEITKVGTIFAAILRCALSLILPMNIDSHVPMGFQRKPFPFHSFVDSQPTAGYADGAGV